MNTIPCILYVAENAGEFCAVATEKGLKIEWVHDEMHKIKEQGLIG